MEWIGLLKPISFKEHLKINITLKCLLACIAHSRFHVPERSVTLGKWQLKGRCNIGNYQIVKPWC